MKALQIHVFHKYCTIKNIHQPNVTVPFADLEKGVYGLGIWTPPPYTPRKFNFFNSLIHSKVSRARTPLANIIIPCPHPRDFFFIRGMVIDDNIWIQYFEQYTCISIILLMYYSTGFYNTSHRELLRKLYLIIMFWLIFFFTIQN